MKRTLITILTLAGLLAGSVTAVAAEAPAGKENKPAKDIVLKGDAQCTSCHDEEDSPEKLAIGKTKHGTQADKRTPTCTSCHGESPTHVKKPEGVKDRPKVDVGYTKRSNTPVAKRNEQCLTCHQGANRMLWAGSTHESRDVACTNCHTMHNQHDNVRDRLTQADVCFTCHKEQRVQISRPSRHPIKEGKVACSDCHNPHGSAGPKMMVRDSVVNTCYTCHMEKRGPFVWNHQPVTEDCSICHNPHGSTVSKMLKARMPFLCQQCHEQTGSGHQGNIPKVTGSGTDLNVGMTLGRGCVNCHTNIHGSNNPTTQNFGNGLVGGRAFVR